MSNPRQWVRESLDEYLVHYPEETGLFDLLRRQLDEEQDIQDRKNMQGHVTSSMFVLNENLTEALLIHHKAFDAWLCAGGHYEGNVPVHISALRELEEETGMPEDMVGLRTLDGKFIIVDVDTHHIPARPNKGEDEHYHHDFLFLARATAPFNPVPQLEEVFGSKWIPLEELVNAPDARVRRATAKVLRLLEFN